MLTGGTFTSIGNETRGRLAALDPATGCVAYWLLTGQHVFSATTPKALDRLVLSCLAKDPRDLSASAKRLSRQLEELRNGNPWTQERAREWWAANQPATP
jgi:hypothetical protein